MILPLQHRFCLLMRKITYKISCAATVVGNAVKYGNVCTSKKVHTPMCLVFGWAHDGILSLAHNSYTKIYT